MSEYSEQCAVIEWGRLFEREYPELRWLHSSLNGAHLTPRHAANMKAAGMTRGIPDLFIPVKRAPYSGLYIEMKEGRNSLTPEQKDFRDFAMKQGFRVETTRGFDETVKVLQDYLR